MGELTNATYDVLMARLLWPVPRIRWEVARSLAELIRAGDKSAAKALLNWISERKLESEVAFGLNVIEAFELGGFFTFEEAFAATNSPSHLSDWMIRRTYGDTGKLLPLRYEFSTDAPATLRSAEEMWFETYIGAAIPPIFSTTMQRLQQRLRFPFYERWKHEWKWLQSIHKRPEAIYPSFFSKESRLSRGQFDLGQRELYVSAYLRTLAYATANWGLPHNVAEHYSLLGMVINRSLADLQPITRPDWMSTVLRATGSSRELADQLLARASELTPEHHYPISLRALEVEDRSSIKIEMQLVIGPSDLEEGIASAVQLNAITTSEAPGDLAGTIGPAANTGALTFDNPLVLAQPVLPHGNGRAHGDIFLNLELASPYIMGKQAKVRCTNERIFLEVGSEVFSTWQHWYCGWESTAPPSIDSYVGFIATVRQRELDERLSEKLAVAWLVRVERGNRNEPYLEFETRTESLWIPYAAPS